MTVGEFMRFLTTNGIPEETEMFVETGIDVFVAIQEAVFDGEELHLYQEHWEEIEIEI